MPPKIRFVVATRKSRQDFFSRTATGVSLSLYKFPFVDLHLQDQNRLGLPVIYNRAIDASRTDPAILVFIHDDVHLCDFYWPDQILHSLTQFQLVGVAGNRRRVARQAAWCFLNDKFAIDIPENLSGVVGHGNGFPPARLSAFGPPCQEVKLLDGLMLIAHSDTLINNNIRFDERFDFHFYDMDFCRQAEQIGIKMGTWPISVVHESSGNFGTEAWRAAYRKYLDKWGD